MARRAAAAVWFQVPVARLRSAGRRGLRLYQISGTWSNHEGSILSWCRILSFYGFLLCCFYSVHFICVYRCINVFT
uniref:Uncharacterized protein n=1 Tax=Daucus carota subsp. sativus TaxID=79200 RepID=A0A166JGI9_DAUCS